MKTSFTSYYWQTFLQPRKAFQDLMLDEQRLRFGFRALLVMVVIYTLVYVFLILGGGQPFTPWLDIPEAVYYQYNVYFLAPSMILGWVLAGGVAQLLSRFFKGTGTFEETLSVLGFGIGIASWSTGLHDLVTSFLGAVDIMNQNEYEAALNSPTAARSFLWLLMFIYLIWFCTLFSIGIGTVQQIKGWRAVLVGVAAFIVYQVFFFIFNR